MRCGKAQQFLFGEKTYFRKEKQCAVLLVSCTQFFHFTLKLYSVINRSWFSRLGLTRQRQSVSKKKDQANFIKSTFGAPKVQTKLATLCSRKKWETSHGSPQVKATCLAKKQLQKYLIYVRFKAWKIFVKKSYFVRPKGGTTIQYNQL